VAAMIGQIGSSLFAFVFSLIVARAFKVEGTGVFTQASPY
jgi:O-antigen/teichoic acid export membrane protein